MNPETTLSSRFTFALKVIFPAHWILVSGLIAFYALIDEDATVGMKWLFLTGWITSSIAVGWGNGRLKRVRVVGDDLYISNYLKEIAVPLSSIESVTKNRWIDTFPAIIHFRNDTPFGRKIMFTPYFSIRGSSHPIVGELTKMIEAAKARVRQRQRVTHETRT